MDGSRALVTFTGTVLFVYAAVITGLSGSLLEIAESLRIEVSRAGILYTLHFAGFLGLIVLTLAVRSPAARITVLIAATAIYAVALGAVGVSRSMLLTATALFVAGGAAGVVESHSASLIVTTAPSQTSADSRLLMTQVFFALGALAAPAYLAIVTRAGSWRLLYFILAAILAAGSVAGFGLRTLRNHPSRPPGRGTGRDLARASVALAFYVGAEVTLFGWIPAVMELYLGVPASRARLAPALFWLGMLGGRVMVATLVKRLGRRLVLPAITLLGAGAALALGIVRWEPLYWFLVLIVSLGCSGIWPLIVSGAGSEGNEIASGIVIAAGGLGGALFPYAAGLIAEVLPGSLVPAAASPLLLVVLLLSSRRRGNEHHLPG